MRHARNIDVCFSPAPRWIQVGFFLQGINLAARKRCEFTLTSATLSRGVYGAT
jgi:hypothetical protein